MPFSLSLFLILNYCLFKNNLNNIFFLIILSKYSQWECFVFIWRFVFLLLVYLHFTLLFLGRVSGWFVWKEIFKQLDSSFEYLSIYLFYEWKWNESLNLKCNCVIDDFLFLFFYSCCNLVRSFIPLILCSNLLNTLFLLLTIWIKSTFSFFLWNLPVSFHSWNITTNYYYACILNDNIIVIHNTLWPYTRKRIRIISSNTISYISLFSLYVSVS